MRLKPSWIALACAGAFVSSTAMAETWRFTVIGDTPYSQYERQHLPAMLEDVADGLPAFVIHVGDIKNSSLACTDTLFRERYALFDASRVPFVFVPGDNEWNDCSRVAAGHYDELERLDKLREIFFSGPESLGQQRIVLQRQSAAVPEHQQWRLGPVLFLTLNVPGPDNNYGMGATPSAEYRARNPIVIDWLQRGFEDARRDKLAGIVVAMQGDPGFNAFAAGLGYAGYRELLETLRDETLAFAGQVLLVHGDTHWNRIDHPMRRPGSTEKLANFARVETFGSPFMGWTTVTIDDKNPLLFRFATQSYPR